MIGTIGSKRLDDVSVFEVSNSFKNLVGRNTVRSSKNDILLRKPVGQYIGPDLDGMSLSIILKAAFGVNPQADPHIFGSSGKNKKEEYTIKKAS